MPPKKKSPKKKGKKKGKANSEELTVTQSLKKRLDEAELAVQAEMALRKKLGEERLERMEVLAALEAEAELARRKQVESAEKAREAFEERQSELENQIEQLAAERGELEVNLGALDLSVATNERLRHEVSEMRAESSKEVKVMVEEEARVKTGAFEMRMQIEGLSRRTLRDLDSDYKDKAEKNILLEAKHAAEHNRTLSKHLEARSTEAVQLLKAQSERAKRLRDTRVVREMLADAKQEHDARILKITTQKCRAEATAIEKNAQIADARVELNWFDDTSMGGRSKAVSWRWGVSDLGDLDER